MITLITGLPGACKTLYTLNFVKQKAEKEGRPVFYNGIPELTLPWEQLEDPEKWHELPEGAIIVIDECQRVFRPRSSSAAVPVHVEKFETHRHKGYDVFLVTQHPMLLDGNVRRLAGQHFHCVRTFGMQRSTIHEWQSVKENCDKQRKDSVRHEFSFPKEAYNWYKSATIHTHQARIPAKVFFLLAVPFIIAFAIWYMYHLYQVKAHPEKDVKAPETEQVKTASTGGASSPGQNSARPGSPGSQSKTRGEYLADYEPRLPGFTHTAPVYDKVTTPVEAPIPAACVMPTKKTEDCRCYSQQATRMPMDSGTCKQIVENGFFVAWQQKQPEQSRPVSVPAEREPRITLIPNPGNGPIAAGAGSSPSSSGSSSKPYAG